MNAFITQFYMRVYSKRPLTAILVFEFPTALKSN